MLCTCPKIPKKKKKVAYVEGASWVTEQQLSAASCRDIKPQRHVGIPRYEDLSAPICHLLRARTLAKSLAMESASATGMCSKKQLVFFSCKANPIKIQTT
jgi:hypothetical protein